MKRNNRTQNNIKKKKRRKKRYLLRLLIIILLCIGLYFTLHIEYFTIEGITVAGNKEISDQEIIELSEIKTGENIFDVSPMFAERRVKKNLYIEDIKIRRALPNRIEMIVNERNGKAQFIMGKKYVITDNDGLVLEIAKEEQRVTLVEGIVPDKAEPNDVIEIEKNIKQYEQAMNIIKAAEEGDLYFKKIKIESGKVEAYVYDELVCKGKYDDIMKSIESETLKAVIFDLYQKDKKRGTINVGRNNYCSFTQ